MLSELNLETGVTKGHWYSPSSRGSMESLVDHGLTYIREGDGSEELYDLENDPAEEHDLSGTPDGQAALARARAFLEQLNRESPNRP